MFISSEGLGPRLATTAASATGIREEYTGGKQARNVSRSPYPKAEIQAVALQSRAVYSRPWCDIQSKGGGIAGNLAM